MHNTIEKKFNLAKYREQSFETIDPQKKYKDIKNLEWILVSFLLIKNSQNLGKGSKYKRKEKRDNSKKIEVCRMRNMEQEKEGRHA